jgi:hypothetical protein
MSFASAILAVYSRFFSLPLIWIRPKFSVDLIPQNDTYSLNSSPVARSVRVCKCLIAKISKASVAVNPYELVAGMLVMVLVMICAECKCAYYLRALAI